MQKKSILLYYPQKIAVYLKAYYFNQQKTTCSNLRTITICILRIFSKQNIYKITYPMKNIKISVKLIFLSLFMSVVMLFIGVSGINNLKKANAEMTGMYDENVAPMVLITTIDGYYSKEMIVTLENLKENRTDYIQGVHQIEQTLEKIKTSWTQLRNLPIDEEEQVLELDVETQMTKLDDHLFLLKNHLMQADTTKFLQTCADYVDVAIPFYQSIDKLLKHQAVGCKTVDLDSNAEYESARIQSYILIIISICISLAIAFWIILGFQKSLKQANDAIERVTRGDFSVKIEEAGNDEVGQVLQMLRTMISRLNESVGIANRISKGDLTMVSELKRKNSTSELDIALTEMVSNLSAIMENILGGANSIAAASGQISSTAQLMSQGASEQASSTEEVTSSMEEMSASIQQNSQNARQTEHIAIKSSGEIEQSKDFVKQTLVAMKDIADKIILINDISEKTDLLAINAGIEAARAGEQGKGFAVVATEVRKLAENSRTASLKIAELIRDSLSIAEKSNELLTDLVPEIQKTSNLVKDISASSNEQNSGASQVTVAMMQLSQVTQQNAAASEELATSAEELSAQAEQLLGILRFFQTENKMQINKKTAAPKRMANNQNESNHESNSGGIKIELNDKFDADFEIFK
ncbi:MAG: hypothetical protein RIS47_141 [Bacteroidota bacterium]